MKLSAFMKKEMDHIRDEYLFDAADTGKNFRLAPMYLVPSNENSPMEKLKKIASAAACVVLAVAVIVAFILMRNSIMGPGSNPSDSETEIGTDTENVEINDEEMEARKAYGYINSVSATNYAYGNFVFGYPKAPESNIGKSPTDILFYDVTQMTDEPMSIFLDAIGDVPFDMNTSERYKFTHYLIDEYGTERNGGIPVLIMCIENTSGESGIYSYDMATRRMTLICDKDPDLSELQSFGLYGDTLYYTYRNGENGSIVCSVKLDGSQYKRLNNENKLYLYLLAADDDHLFLSNGSSVVYRSDTELGNIEKFCESAFFEGCIYDGYFFYISRQKTIISESDGETVSAYNLAKKPVDAKLEDAEEIIAHASVMREVFFADGKFYTQTYGSASYGGYYSEFENTVIEVDLQTGEEKTVLKYTERDDVTLNLCQSGGGGSLIMKLNYYKDGEIVSFEGEYGSVMLSTYHHYNINTGIMTEVFGGYYNETRN